MILDPQDLAPTRNRRQSILGATLAAHAQWDAQARAAAEAEEELAARRYAWRLTAGLTAPAPLAHR